MHEVRVDVRRDVGCGVQHRVQFEHPQGALDTAWELQRLMNSLGRHPCDADQLFCADRPLQRHIVFRAGAHRQCERQHQQVHLQTNLVGDPDQR